MPIIKNEIPILEYDVSSAEVIAPGLTLSGLTLPGRCVFAFLGDVIDEYAASVGAREVGIIKTITMDFPIYVTEYGGREITLCRAPLGSAAAVQILDDLIGVGVKKAVCAGSCGALIDLPENAFLVPTRALRAEGASYHYLPPARYIDLDADMIAGIERVLERRGVPYDECTTWSTDGFFRETKDMVDHRRAEGCSVVEMECAGLAACARFRGASFGQLLYTADSLADIELYDTRDWGRASCSAALSLCLEVAAEL